MRKISKRIVALALIGLLSTKSEKNAEEIFTGEVQIRETENNNSNDTIVLDENTIKGNDKIDEPNFIKQKTLTMTRNVEFREYRPDGEVLGIIPEGRTIDVVDELDNNWHFVAFNGTLGCIYGDDFIEGYKYQIDEPWLKMAYATSDVYLTSPEALCEEGMENEILIPKNECFEIYREFEDDYLVATNEYVGYVNKYYLNNLEGTYAVVDLSDQELRLYQNNEIIMTSPVVTGKPSSPSDEGAFEIFAKDEDRYLKGPGYSSYVDYFMPYNGGEGLHDAEYHTNPDGKKHGWREKNEFGGDIYLTKGSHGCINMRHDEVEFAFKNLEVGSKVIVKK